MSRTSLEHSYWVMKAARYFENQGYGVSQEDAVDSNGTVDLLAERPTERLAVEIETGKVDTKGNLAKLREKGLDHVVLVAASPAAVSPCRQVMDDAHGTEAPRLELLTWLHVS